jgi:opacity protein-like surface antigen
MKKIVMLAASLCLLSGYAIAADSGDRSHAAGQGYGQNQNSGAAQYDGHDQHGDQLSNRGKQGGKAGIYVGADSFGIYLDSNAHDKNWRRHTEMRRDAHEDHFGDWYADPNRYHAYNRNRWHKNDCFPVSRHAYDRWGHRVTNVAMMCYKRNGRSYIVPESRRTYN